MVVKYEGRRLASAYDRCILSSFDMKCGSRRFRTAADARKFCNVPIRLRLDVKSSHKTSDCVYGHLALALAMVHGSTVVCFVDGDLISLRMFMTTETESLSGLGPTESKCRSSASPDIFVISAT